MLLLLSFSFISGLVTILAPCIWPLLPIILSSTLGSTSHKKPLGITLGIMISFGFFTLAISYLVMLFHLNPNILRLVAVIVIGLLGLSLVIPALSNQIELLVSRLSGLFGRNQQKGNGFGSGFVTGLSLGVVWAPCAGPILAAIATLAATSQLSGQLILITASYITGIGIPLFLFAYGGQTLFNKTKFISKYTPLIQKIFGIIMILTAIAIYTNYDKVIQTKLLNLFPSYTNALTNFGNSSEIKNQLDILRGQKTATETNSSGLPILGRAPDFTGGTKWLNSEPLSLQKLKGKVVLVDFWTYTCINCIRTLPFVTHWYDTYKDKGFIVIGVHTPEFAFEHDSGNVLNAIKMFKIHYPVVQDNDYSIWNNYANQYWPAEYLIDANGNVRHTHFGEGEYDQTEQLIVQLLQEAGKKVGLSSSDMTDQTPHAQISPETYLGSKRMEFLYPSGSTGNGIHNFSLANPPQDSFSFGGLWDIEDENAISDSNASLQYNFYANKVYLVITPKNSSDTVKVFLDGKPITADVAGADVRDGFVALDSSRLYNLVDLHDKPGSHLLKLEFSNGIKAFAFTFG